jgi:tetratricopeptide (TPR) repeat protein
MTARLYFKSYTALILTGFMIMALAFAQGYSNPIQQSDQLLQQGDQQLGNNDFQGALTSFQSALSMYSQIVNTTIANNDSVPIKLQIRISRALAATAVAYQGLGDSTNASDYAQKALILGKQLNDRFTIQNATQVLANINRGHQPNISRSQIQTNTCDDRCSEPYTPGHMSIYIQCIEAGCRGTETMEKQENQRQANKDQQNQQCENEYNAQMARGVDGTTASLRYSHCIQH